MTTYMRQCSPHAVFEMASDDSQTCWVSDDPNECSFTKRAPIFGNQFIFVRVLSRDPDLDPFTGLVIDYA